MAGVQFLSCLGGSELLGFVARQPLYFLSCLGGSEQHIILSKLLLLKNFYLIIHATPFY